MITVIGIDPGPTPGIVLLDFYGENILERHVVQCSAISLLPVLDGLGAIGADVIAIEKFVTGRGTMRAGADGDLTRNQVERVARRYPRQVNATRRAADVKPWATDERLAHAGLLEPTKGMRHAKDAARHALFAAVRDAGLPDPLSRRRRAD